MCEDGYTGARCTEISPDTQSCSPDSCLNNGKCVVLNNKEICDCPLEYMGSKCQKPVEKDLNPCTKMDCRHGGVCQVGIFCVILYLNVY